MIIEKLITEIDAKEKALARPIPGGYQIKSMSLTKFHINIYFIYKIYLIKNCFILHTDINPKFCRFEIMRREIL